MNLTSTAFNRITQELRHEIAKLEQQLTTEREARKKLEDELAENRRLAFYNTQTIREYKQRAESAEQQIKEAQEQQPIYEVISWGSWCEVTNKYEYDIRPEKERRICYAAPMPSTETQEAISKLVDTIKKLEVLGQDNVELRSEVSRLSARNEWLEETLMKHHTTSRSDGLHIKMDFKIGESIISICNVISYNSLIHAVDAESLVGKTCRHLYQRLSTDLT